MNVPVVLPVVRAIVVDDGTIAVTIDDEPYTPSKLSAHRSGRTITRGDLRQVVDDIAAERQTAVRVEVTETNGTTYADIATPPEPDTEPAQDAHPDEPDDSADLAARLSAGASERLPGITGTGFRPGEQVAIAYVLTQDLADASGAASLRLPAALLALHASSLVLLGLDSKRLAPITTAEHEAASA